MPLVVRSDGDAFELVAGFHRLAAARSLGLSDVPVVIRDADTEDARIAAGGVRLVIEELRSDVLLTPPAQPTDRRRTRQSSGPHAGSRARARARHRV